MNAERMKGRKQTRRKDPLLKTKDRIKFGEPKKGERTASDVFV